VREFFLSNARYWISEFHLDGLRLDATQALFDASEKHILSELVQTVRQAAAPKSTIVIGENEPQDSKLMRPVDDQGYGLDGLWNDDFHHSAMVALTGHNEAYYTDYFGNPQEFISGAKRGYLYQGQYYRWQKKRRGASTMGIKPAAFINYLQNHDQVANSGRGWRVHRMADPGVYRALTAIFLLSPQTPMLFQGQEFAASTPFAYFADHGGKLAEKVKRGRREFLHQFPSLAAEAMQPELPDPTESAPRDLCAASGSSSLAPYGSRLQLARGGGIRWSRPRRSRVAFEILRAEWERSAAGDQSWDRYNAQCGSGAAACSSARHHLAGSLVQ
jgi:maltooligosyltrehalose trehalohydrolase